MPTDESQYPVSRREVLTGAAGIAGLAGIGGAAITATNKDDNSRGTGPGDTSGNNDDSGGTEETGAGYDREEIARSIPVDGLENYEEWVLEADSSGIPSEQVRNVLEGKMEPRQKAVQLGQISNEHSHSYNDISEQGAALAQTTYAAQAQTENNTDFLFNINEFTAGNTREIIDIIPVQGNQAQKAVITDPEMNVINTSKNDNTHQIYHNVRNSEKWGSTVSQDVEGWKNLTDYSRSKPDTSEEEISQATEREQRDHSYALLGDNNKENFMFADVVSGDVWFEVAYIEGGSIDILTGPSQAYTGSEYDGNDEWARGKHRGDGDYTLHNMQDFEPGDPLPEEADL